MLLADDDNDFGLSKVGGMSGEWVGGGGEWLEARSDKLVQVCGLR